MIKQVILGILLGVSATLLYIQQDPWSHTHIAHFFTRMLGQLFHCTMHGAVERINFLSPEIVFKDFTATCADESLWNWHAAQFKMGFSWFDVLVKRRVSLWTAIQDLRVTSALCNNEPAILPHVRDLLSPPNLPIPIYLTNGVIESGSFSLQSESLNASCSWSAQSARTHDRFRTYLTVSDGAIAHQNHQVTEKLFATLVLDAFDDATIGLQTKCQLKLFGLPACDTCLLQGKFYKNSGKFYIENLDKTFSINPIIITQKDMRQWFEMVARIPASYCVYLATKKQVALQGDCEFRMKGTYDQEQSIDGHCMIAHLSHPLIPHTLSCSSTFRKRNTIWDGSVDIRLPENMILNGYFGWDADTHHGVLDVKNNTPLAVAAYPAWKIPRHGLAFRGAVTQDDFVGDYVCSLRNHVRKKNYTSSGELRTDRKDYQYTLAGTLRDFKYQASGSWLTYPYISRAYCYQEQSKPYFDLTHHDEDQTYKGKIQIPALRAVAHYLFGYDVPGEGLFEFNTKYHNARIDTNFHLHEGTIRLPQTFNFINGIDGALSFDVTENRATFDHISCTLHTGSLAIPHGVLSLDSSGALSFCHIPLVLDHCLLNLKRDLFAMVSGLVCFSKRPNEIPCIKGNLHLDRSQLKENVFSELFQKNLVQTTRAMQTAQGLSVACDMRVETKEPIRIFTGFLDAHAQCDLSIKKQLTDPEIEGLISVLSGTLEFPYKPLLISRGTVNFVKNQPLNPHVELVAKNSIKQHTISLHVSGSLQDNFVLLESTPSLTNEQIIGLLLAGSYEESLSAVIPTILVQNVKNIIFSSDQLGSLDRYVKPWLKQINVHLVPRLSEQSGRGGLRGALEIDVNERWRAMIEKNFSLTEDTRFELEYLLSDDVRFRVIRDERCDIGAEVEMKWKF